MSASSGRSDQLRTLGQAAADRRPRPARGSPRRRRARGRDLGQRDPVLHARRSLSDRCGSSVPSQDRTIRRPAQARRRPAPRRPPPRRTSSAVVRLGGDGQQRPRRIPASSSSAKWQATVLVTQRRAAPGRLGHAALRVAELAAQPAAGVEAAARGRVRRRRDVAEQDHAPALLDAGSGIGTALTRADVYGCSGTR